MWYTVAEHTLAESVAPSALFVAIMNEKILSKQDILLICYVNFCKHLLNNQSIF